MLEKLLYIGRKIIPKRLFSFGQPIYHFGLALLANLIYRFPGRKIRVIGVTGTNGKSTTSNLIVSILEEAGFKIGLSSTTNFQIGEKKWDNLIDKTMGGRFQTIKLLRQMVNAKCDYAVIEVPSHGISQYRVWAVPFDVAVLTNITHDHLDYHKTFENYVATKEKLFANVARSRRKRLRFPSEDLTTGQLNNITTGNQNNPSTALRASRFRSKKAKVKKYIILNHDDPLYGRFNKHRADLNISYSTKNKRASLLAKNIKIKESGASFDIASFNGSLHLDLKLTGLFNVYNALAAAAVGFSQDIDILNVNAGLEKVERIPGRLEIIRKNGKTVVIDYAHTPDALENILKTVRQFTEGNLIAVFGATGDRDKTKRPIMGEIGGKLADIVYITDEEPGNEDPKKIIEEIEPGIVRAGKILNENYFKITDRKKAIEEAIKNAKAGDSVVITGIGHQRFRMIKGKQEPWDERALIEALLK